MAKAAQAPWWTSKVTLWIAGLLLAALSTAGGFLFNRVKSLQVERSVIMAERDQLAQVSRTALVLVQQAETRSKTNESRYRKLLLATNPITGEPLFDKAGNPIFNSDEGSAEAMEQLQANYQSVVQENMELKQSLYSREDQIKELSLQTSRPARSPWDFSLGYSAPFAEWLTLPAATLWAGTGYHLDLMGMDVAVRGEGGLSPGTVDRLGETAAGKLQLVLRP